MALVRAIIRLKDKEMGWPNFILAGSVVTLATLGLISEFLRYLLAHFF